MLEGVDVKEEEFEVGEDKVELVVVAMLVAVIPIVVITDGVPTEKI